jgi:hypothetical protein
MRAFVLLAAAVFCVCWTDLASAYPGEEDQPALQSAEAARRQNAMCGPNSLYMFLALHDIPVNKHTIEQLTPSHPDGMSLAELKAAAMSFGLKTYVRRRSMEELRGEFQSPVIAYLVNGATKHYVIILQISEETVTLLDGTSGEKETLKCRWLEGSWSGYVLMADDGLSTSWLLVASALLVLMLLGLVALTRMVRNDRATPPIRQESVGHFASGEVSS